MSEAPFAAPGSRGSGGGVDGYLVGPRHPVDYCKHGEYDPQYLCVGYDRCCAPISEPAPIIGGTVTWPVEEAGDEDGEHRGTQFSDHIARRRASHERRLATAPVTFDFTTRTVSWDDDRNSYFPRALPDPVRDIGGARAVDHRKRVRERRSWLEPAAWLRLPGLTWHKCNQLVRKWRDK